MNFNFNQFLVFITLFMVLFYPSSARPAPYLKPDSINIDRCDDKISIGNRLFDEHTISQNIDNLLYIPFNEMTIRDFGIHKYVVNRNINTIMNYHNDPHLINVIVKSLNQSTFEITRLVSENRVELEAMSKHEFISNFMDFWVAYRLIQLSEFSSNSLDILANIFKDTHKPIKNNSEL